MTRIVVSQVARLQSFSTSVGLSGREFDVLLSAARGRSMKETAAVLSLSPKTVENYWTRIYQKTGRSSQLAVIARLWEADRL